MKPFICNYYILLLLCFTSYITAFPYIFVYIYIWGISEIEIQVLDKELDFALILNPSYEKILKISPGEYIFDGSLEISLLKIFLINQRFALNLTGDLFLVILFWNFFLSQLEKEIFNDLNDFVSVPYNMSKEDWE